jgi:hypothetical protein
MNFIPVKVSTLYYSGLSYLTLYGILCQFTLHTKNNVSSICDTLVISPAALTRHDVTRSNLSGDTSAQTCHDGEDTFFASGTNPA